MSAEKICPTCGTEYPANERFCPRDGTALRSTGGGNDLVGSVIAERYHVLKKLGEGGMGQVYLAEHVKMGRKSAVKVMNPGMVHDADAISRFNREAANASRINHPNVAGIYDFGETADGLIYLAMEFIEGESLTSVVEKAGALTPIRAAEITRQAAEGLQIAHDMGIVHRDLKPDNIMIARGRDGADLVKVVDFGIAKAAGSENQKVTKTGLVVGTPEYMSPEQLAGDKLDGRSDIYSLALVAFNMLTGRLPFQAESAQESMIMRLTDEPKTLQEMKPDTSWSPEVQAVMRKALQRRREDRYDKAAQFGQELWTAVDRMPKSAPADMGTMVMGAATAVITAPPATRIDASVPAAPAPVAHVPAAGIAAPAKSKMPILAGGGALVVVLAIVGYMVSRPVPPSAPATDKAAVAQPIATPVTSSPVGAAQNVPAAPAGGTRPAGGSAPKSTGTPVTQPGGAVVVSYASELETMANSINSEADGKSALKKLEDYDGKVSLPTDKANMKFVEAKASIYAVGADKGCRMMKLVNRSALSSGLRTDLDEALKECP
ncbi:MAG: Serine/threonine-protein kinase PknB [Gemmatimonadetes bacterium]|nr:Serine/threonine-protein kinase PknB [Gemmatimonadota bacterium]